MPSKPIPQSASVVCTNRKARRARKEPCMPSKSSAPCAATDSHAFSPHDGSPVTPACFANVPEVTRGSWRAQALQRAEIMAQHALFVVTNHATISEVEARSGRCKRRAMSNGLAAPGRGRRCAASARFLLRTAPSMKWLRRRLGWKLYSGGWKLQAAGCRSDQAR